MKKTTGLEVTGTRSYWIPYQRRFGKDIFRSTFVKPETSGMWKTVSMTKTVTSRFRRNLVCIYSPVPVTRFFWNKSFCLSHNLNWVPSGKWLRTKSLNSLGVGIILSWYTYRIGYSKMSVWVLSICFLGSDYLSYRDVWVRTFSVNQVTWVKTGGMKFLSIMLITSSLFLWVLPLTLDLWYVTLFVHYLDVVTWISFTTLITGL